MKVLADQKLLVGVVLTVLLGACSSSSDPTSSESDNDIPMTPGDQQSDEPDPTPIEPIDDPQMPVDGPATDDPQQPPGGNPEPEPTPTPDPGEEPDPEPNPEPDTDPMPGIPNVPDILIPNVSEGSDLDRLINGVNRQASRTILDLVQRLSEGTLTDQQNDCLGAYDPAVGEALLSISCEQALATGDVALYVGEAAFYDTQACRASVFEGNSAECQLQRASVTIRTEWIVPGNGLPPQPIPGMQINYALDGTSLRVENTVDMLSGAFRCDIELSTGQSQPALGGQSCADIIASAANRIETLLPEQ